MALRNQKITVRTVRNGFYYIIRKYRGKTITGLTNSAAHCNVKNAVLSLISFFFFGIYQLCPQGASSLGHKTAAETPESLHSQAHPETG